jgi:D-glycero-D-manno-heptose 1,7-bisphosphate phosphatase
MQSGLSGKTMSKNKALFLDRDGVINLEHTYVHSPETFHFQEGIFELCRDAQRLDYLLLVVTNQAGIARGYYSEAQFLALTTWMIREFDQRQIRIERVYYCPYHPTHGVGRYRLDSSDRKPKPGMLLRARNDFNLDLTSSLLIGDQLSDISAAEAAGVGTKILLRSGAAETRAPEDAYHILDSLEAIRLRFFSSLPADCSTRLKSAGTRRPRALSSAGVELADRESGGQSGPPR